jgi:hypothetical protein
MGLLKLKRKNEFTEFKKEMKRNKMKRGKKNKFTPASTQISNSGVDLSLIKKYLSLTPTERILANQSAASLALELKKGYASRDKKDN